MDIGPGDYVECIDASPCQFTGAKLIEGALYVVSEAREAQYFENAKEPSVWLVGDPPRLNRDGVVMGWRICRFRKIYRPKDSFLKSLLEAAKEDEPA